MWLAVIAAFGALPACRVNGYYYELKVKGEQTWAL